MPLEPVRLVTYHHAGAVSIGLVDDDVIWDLPRSYGAHRARSRHSGAGPAFLPADMRGFMALGQAGIDAALEAAQACARDGVESFAGAPVKIASSAAGLLPPIPDPSKILCMGLIFPTHAVATGQKLPERPQIFMKPSSGLVGHDGPIVIPRVWPDRIVPGTELCVVIGTRCRGVAEDRALDQVYGYTVLNDVTARGFPFPQNKILDSFAPVGPWIVPKAYVGDPQDVALRIKVNGAYKEDVHTKDMVFPVARQIRDCAEIMTLEPGDLIATGDVGSECWLKPGDLVEAEVERVGTLANRCIAEVV